MKIPSKTAIAVSILGSVLVGIALAAYELDNFNRGMNVGKAIAHSVAKGLGGTISQSTVTVSVSLCFGLIPVGTVDNPYLVIAVGDVILGTLVTLSAVAIVWVLRETLRRNHPQDKSRLAEPQTSPPAD